jgi:twinkle protein
MKLLDLGIHGKQLSNEQVFRRNMGTIVKSNLPCTAPDSCGSSNAMAQYDDGGKFCHKCHGWDNSEKSGDYKVSDKPRGKQMSFDFEFYHNAEYKGIPDRRIDLDTCKKFGMKTTIKGSHLFPAYNPKGDLVAVKERFYPDKKYQIHGDMSEAMLFGMQVFPKTGRSVTITEGEYDAMAAYRMTGSKYPHFSIFNGSGSAKKECKRGFEALKNFESITLNFDADAPGDTATEEVGPLFPGRTKVLRLTEGKDACDYLVANKGSKYVDEFFRARQYTLGGIINGADTWEKYKEKKNVESIPFDPQYVVLNQKTYGTRLGEIVLLTAGTGSGKTQILREWKYHLLTTTMFPILDISLEEDTGDTVGGLMAIHANKRIMLPDVNIPEAEEKRIHDELFSNKRFFALDHEGAVEDDSLLDKMEYAATVDGVKIIFLDHITIAVSDCVAGSENLSMDKFMNRLLKLVKRLNICVVVVSHLRKVGGGGKSFEEGRIPTEDDLKGSGSLKQISMTTIAIARNKYAENDKERNTTSFHVLKCRFSGRTGPCDFAHFDDDTGRMYVVNPDTFFDDPQSEFDDKPIGSY